MTHYDYTARHPTKGNISGTIEANNKVDAIKLVERLGYTPITVNDHISKPAAPPIASQSTKVSTPVSQPTTATSVKKGEPVCQLCGSAMRKTVVSSGNCAGIVVALIVFAVGIIIAVAIPVIGWVIGPLICIGALFMGGKRQKVWKCTQCSAVANRA